MFGILRKFDLHFAHVRPIGIAHTGVIDPSNHKGNILSLQVFFDSSQQPQKAFFVGRSQPATSVRLSLHPNEGDGMKRFAVIGFPGFLDQGPVFLTVLQLGSFRRDPLARKTVVFGKLIILVPKADSAARLAMMNDHDLVFAKGIFNRFDKARF